MREAFAKYLGRHFPALWWRYPRSPYRLHKTDTWHHRHDVVSRLTDGARRCAIYFWWCFLWGCAWTGLAWAVHRYYGMPFWPSLAVFVLGSWEGRLFKERRKALFELRGREADLIMAKDFRAAGQREIIE